MFLTCKSCNNKLIESDYINVYECYNNQCSEFKILVYPKKKEHCRYTTDSVRIIECSSCHKDTLMSRMGKIKNYIYCEQCYLKKMDNSIAEFGRNFKHFRNGKGEISRSDMEKSPRLSEYIN